MRLGLWIALLVPLLAMMMGLRTKKYAWNCVLTLSCALIVALTGRGAQMLPLVAALVISVLGDFFMAHKAGRTPWYIAGIAGFLLAHLCFIAYAAQAFVGSARIYLAGAALLALMIVYLLKRVLPQISEKPMQAAVAVYALVSVVSVVLASGLGGSEFERILYAFGILLIALSDCMIAENDFVGNRECGAYIMPTYYLCHILVAASAVVGMAA